jgi:two-component system, cell cycle sensor histidine kinase and response regulator CckA
MRAFRQIDAQLKHYPDWLRAYILTLAALTAATVLAAIFLRAIGPQATIVVSLLGDLVFLGAAWLGYGPGILVCALITFAVPPLLAPGHHLNVDFGRFGLLLIISLLISRVSSSKRRSEAMLRDWGESMNARVRERTLALEESESRYRLLFEKNPQPMWVYDQNTLAFLTVNDTAVYSYGYTREEFQRMTLKDIRPEEDIPKLLEVTAVPATEFHKEGPWRHRKKNGQIIPVEITENPLVFEGRPASLVMATDITERLRLEEQFRQAQRMESIGRLAGGVAHDFNNLLTVINGYTEFLLDETPASDSARDALAEIRTAGERASDLTKQLLAFSRQQVIKPAVININTIVTETEVFLRRLIGEDVQLLTRLEPDLGPVQADAGQVQQIIMNLAVNSRDAMPDGGTLLIETGNATLTDEYHATHPQVQPGNYVLLAVTDTGEGMSPDVQARIFEPFFTTKALGKGTGLGLATVYGMVKHSGGWIWVYSEPERGTTFKIYLPQTDKPLTPAGPAITPGVRGTETILIVEDQDEVRRLAVTGLSRYGYSAHGVSSGAEALQFCREFPGDIHIVVTDVVMPDMNGREVARQVACLRPESRIVFMSGYTTNVIVHRGILDEDVEYLQKPFTSDSLARKVREVLERTRDTSNLP